MPLEQDIFMKNIEITTAQKVIIQYELATVGNRFAAFFIDILIWIGMLIFMILIADQVFKGNLNGFEYYLYFAIVPIVLFYTLLSEILLDGQTIGKKAIGLKVVKLNGDPAAAFDYIIRWAFRFVDIWMSAGAVAALLISSSNYNQRLGCLLSGTTVIRKISTRSFKLEDILKINSRESYVPVFPQVTKLSEGDMLFVKKVMERARKYKNDAHQTALVQLAEKIAALLEVKAPKDSMKFLKTILSDYIVLTR